MPANQPGRNGGRQWPKLRASREDIQAILRQYEEGASADDIAANASRIASFKGGRSVYTITIKTNDELATVTPDVIRTSIENDQPSGPLRDGIDAGAIPHVTIGLRAITFYCTSTDLRSRLEGTTAVICGKAFKFPESDALAKLRFFDIYGFNAQYSTADLFAACYNAELQPVVVFYVDEPRGNKTLSTTVRVYVASSSIPDGLKVDGGIANQICLDGDFFPIHVQRAPVVRTNDPFKKDGGRCVYLMSRSYDATSDDDMEDGPQGIGNNNGTNVGDGTSVSGSSTDFRTGEGASGLGSVGDNASVSGSDTDTSDGDGATSRNHGIRNESNSHDDGASDHGASRDDEDASAIGDSQNDDASTADDPHDDGIFNAVDAQDNGIANAREDPKAADNTSSHHDMGLGHADNSGLNLSLSMIDGNNSFSADFDSSLSLEASFMDDDFVAMWRSSNKKRPAPVRESQPMRVRSGPRNRYELLEAYEIDLELEAWTAVGDEPPARFTIKPVVKFPKKKQNLSQQFGDFPTTQAQDSDSPRRVVYTDNLTLRDVEAALRTVSKTSGERTSADASDASLRNAKLARVGWTEYDDPSVLVNDIKQEPLAHAFMFGYLQFREPGSVDNAIRFHAVHRVLALSDDDTIRSFDQRAVHLLQVEQPVDRIEVLKAFRLLEAETSDTQLQSALYFNDVLALFELALMMWAPEFYFNDLVLATYLRDPVMWLPAEPMRLIHPLSLVRIMSVQLGTEVLAQLSKVMPSHRWCSALTSCSDLTTLTDSAQGVVVRREGDRRFLAFDGAMRC